MGLLDAMEDLKNRAGVAKWQQGRDLDRATGYNAELADRLEPLFSLAEGSAPLGGLAGAIQVSHGSPHAFTKFLMSKMGTGEGAQAFGSGHYFAGGYDSPIAKGYRKSRNNGFLYNVNLTWPDSSIESINPMSPNHFLDWDKPLSEQNENIKNIFSKMNKIDSDKIMNRLESSGDSDGFQIVNDDGKFHAINHNDGTYKTFKSINDALTWIKPYVDEYAGLNPKGSKIYRSLVDLLGGQNEIGQIQASQHMKELGIPGIKYDPGFNDPKNYVVFDDRIPNIVTRNGVPISTILDDEATRKTTGLLGD